MLEVNPRSSRTVPVPEQGDRRADGDRGDPSHAGPVAGRAGLPGRALAEAAAGGGQGAGLLDGQAARVDTYLGPEMKSTGEVMGIDRTLPGRDTRR